MLVLISQRIPVAFYWYRVPLTVIYINFFNDCQVVHVDWELFLTVLTVASVIHISVCDP